MAATMEGLNKIKEESIDLEVFVRLKCSSEGLTSSEADARTAMFGPNKLEEKKVMAIVFANSDNRPPDWQSSRFFSSTPSRFGKRTTPGARPRSSMANVAPRTKVLRDGRWSDEDAAILVLGDIISIKLGDIGDPLKIDQSALTGECLPVTKNPGNNVYSGSTCKQGEIEAVVIATGVHTFFGKAAHLVDSTNQVGHFQKVLQAIGNFCIASIAIGILIEVIVMYPVQHRRYPDGIDNLLDLTMAIGSHRLSKQGAITKRMTAIEEMLSVDRSLVEIFAAGVEKDDVVLFAARASRLENQDAIDAAMVGMLDDPKEAREGIEEVHLFPFNPVDKRTALTYIDLADGSWHRVSKGAPEQILDLCNCGDNVRNLVHTVIDKYAERGLRSLAEVPEKSKESPGEPWEFVGLLPLLDPPRSDCADTINHALNLGVNVRMITGDQLAIAKETGRRLGMGTNMYPPSALLGQNKDEATASIPVDELIEKADGFAGHKYEIVKKLQEMKRICGMTGDGVNDAPALKKADIRIAVAGATDAARSASDIVLTLDGLCVIISAVVTSRAIFQRMKNYTLGFMLIVLIWKFDFSPFMILVIAILNDGTIMTIAKDRVKPSPHPDSWKLNEIFATGIVYGTYLAVMTVIFFWAIRSTDFFSGQRRRDDSALYLQVSIISQALIFVTRSRSWCFIDRPGYMLCAAFIIAQNVATVIAVYANFEFAKIQGIGWGWAGVIWLYSFVNFVPLDLFNFAIRYVLSGKAWNIVQNKTAFPTKKNYSRMEREAQWAAAQRRLHGLPLSEIVEQARHRAEIARYREQSTLRGHLELSGKLRGIDLDAVKSLYYTV
ncbi:hypothetical protein PVAP13_1NG267719 [Panicum virgatum]|uniref:Plasma membrane ATPase n=1 Tax=Panicum virgatum TaxID=38727 RepID=A0A8T0WPF2_PANVG|nr:hypothetical protein PVAP13_1NG267719 [Panicum virgatum]